MKANEAPDKIYINDFGSELSYDWHTEHCCESDIEYTRTDAFIEKACKFISDRVDIPFKVECCNGEPLADSYAKYALARLEAANKIIEDFRKYMEGE